MEGDRMVEENRKISSLDTQEISYHLSANLEKYLERFEKIEKRERTFNFCAGFFTNSWMAYQFMLPECLIAWSIEFGAQFFISMWLLYSNVNDRYLSVKIRLGFYLFWILKFILFGFFGDRWLFKSIKVRIKKAREGKVGVVSYMTASEKAVVFRGVSVVACWIIMLLSEQWQLFLIDLIVY
jgi:hypothetical protein